MSIPRKAEMYDLLYIVGGRVKEIVETNKPIAICKWKGNLLKKENHNYRHGLLQPRRVSSRPKGGWMCIQ